jgi:adenylylsulfate kinase-like enzyme
MPQLKIAKKSCEGLYQRPRNGKIHSFTWVKFIYERPIQPDLLINTGELSINRKQKKPLK